MMDLIAFSKPVTPWDKAVLALVVFSAGFIIYQLYQAFIYPYYFSPLRHLPGPKDHDFFIGHTLKFFRSGHPEEPYRTWMRQWPDEPLIRYFGFGNTDAVLINSLQAYKEVLHTQCYSCVRTTSFRRLIQDIIGVGLVFAEGDEQKRQRKVLGGLFTVSNVKSYLDVFREKAVTLAEEFEKAVSNNGGMIDAKTAYTKVTLDVIGIFALGMELKNLEGPTEFMDCYQTVFDPSMTGQILAAINMIFPIRWLPMPAANREFVKANATLRRILSQITQQRIDDVAAGKTKKYMRIDGAATKDLLTFMVEEKYMSSKDPWTKADLVEQVLNFVATGHETTASALTWATHALGSYPEVTKRLRAEALELLKTSPTPTFTEIENMQYLSNFTRETLRVNCPVNGIDRQATHDVVIAGIPCKKGTVFMPIPSIISYNPNIWGENAEDFDPDRWDRLSGPASDPFAFAAFGHGPRSCIGKAMALLNFKTIIIELVTRFDFEAVNKGKVEVVNPSGQLRPSGAMWIKVTRAEDGFVQK